MQVRDYKRENPYKFSKVTTWESNKHGEFQKETQRADHCQYVEK